MSPALKGAIFSTVCSAGVGLQMVFGKLALAQTEAATCATYLITFATGFSLLAVRGFNWRRITPSAARNVMIHSVLALTGIIFMWLGLQQLNATVATFVSRTEVIVSIACAVVFLGEYLTLQRLLGFTIGMLGVVVMSWPDEKVGTWWQPGLAYMLIASIGWGSCEIFAKKTIDEVPISVFLVLRNFIICSMLWVYLLATGAPALMPTEAFMFIVLCAFLGPFFARFMFMRSLQYIPLSVSVGLNQTQPIFAAIFGVLAGLALPGALEWVGGVIIVAGCLCLLSRPSAKTSTDTIAA